MSTTVYRSRSRTLRNRLLVAAEVVLLIVAGWLLGRSSASPAPAKSAPIVSSAPSPSAEPSPAPVPTGGVDAYQPLQVEDAAEVSGLEMQDTEDEGGGRNAGWINNGDFLRFDDVNFGASPPASVNVRVATDTDKTGRIEIRIDSKDSPPVATLTTSRTGGWQNWITQTTDMAPVTGLHTVYVTFGNPAPDDFINLNWLVFRRG